MPKFYTPSSGPEQWSQLLADPERHWRQGYSARTLAYSWEAAGGFPSEVSSVLKPLFGQVEMLLALPEHKVSLPGGSRPSQNDIWVLGRSPNGLVSIAVEGKVSESFDKTVGEWQPQSTPGRAERYAFLLSSLGLASAPDSIRYQLLHRTVSAIIEAQRFGARDAVMLVHSFSSTSEWFEDYAAFVTLLGGSPSKDGLTSVGPRSGVDLHLAWVSGDQHFLTA
jgi:hypothetical protein